MVNVANIASASLLAVTQRIAQAVNVLQSVTCQNENEAVNDVCQVCLTASDPALCVPVCQCNIRDLSMRQVVTVEFRAIQQQENRRVFFQSFLDNLYLEASRTHEGFPGLKSDQQTLQTAVNNLYDAIITENVQKALQALGITQIVRLEGPGLITGVNMRQMVQQVSSILQSNVTVTQALGQVEQNLAAMTQEVTIASVQLLIVSFIMLNVIGLVIFLVWECAKLLFALL